MAEKDTATERRCDDETRHLIDRAAEAGAMKALQRLGDLTPFDLSEKEGRDALRAVIEHATLLKQGCDTIRSTGGRAVVKVMVWTAIGVLVAGAAWSLGIDPAKVMRWLNGGR